jgi:Zn-dependent peptidase ImmA (M78 family)
MRTLCTKSGVALVLVSELPRTHIYGATRWLNKDKALLMLSLRYKTNDHFWFSFFHEAAHIILHGKKCIFIDEKAKTMNDMEVQADQFSRNILVPTKSYEAFVEKRSFSQADIERFAKSVNVAPGIVVGFLQHDKHIPYSWHNRLKEKFRLLE